MGWLDEYLRDDTGQRPQPRLYIPPIGNPLGLNGTAPATLNPLSDTANTLGSLGQEAYASVRGLPADLASLAGGPKHQGTQAYRPENLYQPQLTGPQIVPMLASLLPAFLAQMSQPKQTEPSQPYDRTARALLGVPPRE